MPPFVAFCACVAVLCASVTAAEARSHTGAGGPATGHANSAECTDILRQAYQCKQDIRHQSHRPDASQSDLAAQEAECDRMQDRYVAECRK